MGFGNVWCQTSPQKPRLYPPLLIHYPRLFRSQYVLDLPQQVLNPSYPKLEIFGELQGTRRIFIVFCADQKRIQIQSYLLAYFGESCKGTGPGRLFLVPA